MRFDASLTSLFPGVPLLDRFARARAAGFEAVELQDLGDEDPERLAEVARAANVEVVLINASLGDAPSGGPGLSGVPGREASFRDAIARARGAARALCCTRVHVGPCRLAVGVTRDHALDTLARNLRWAGDFLGEQGIEALVEALNPHDVPGVLVEHVDVAVDVVERVDHSNVRLLFDAYHVARVGGDVVQSFERCARVISHVQIADCPGRGAPGTGRVDYRAFLAVLALREYGGWIGAEYAPGEPSHATLAWLRSATALSTD